MIRKINSLTSFQSSRGLLSVLLIGLAPFLATPVCAANFTIFPLKSQLDLVKTNDAFTLRNQGDAPVVVQATVVKWSQQSGKEILEPTRDLLVAPALTEVPAGESQVIRVALRRPLDAKTESSYRLIIQEVPKPSQSKIGQVLLALKLSLPMFVAPATASAKSKLEIGSIRTVSNEKEAVIALDLANAGTGHVISVKMSDEKGVFAELKSMFYVLPDTQRSFMLNPTRIPEKGRPLKVDFQTNLGEVSSTSVLH